jgi:hypothetical protein
MPSSSIAYPAMRRLALVLVAPERGSRMLSMGRRVAALDAGDAGEQRPDERVTAKREAPSW